MDNNEILKSFVPKKELNPKIWDLNSGPPAMKSEVREKLLETSNIFID